MVEDEDSISVLFCVLLALIFFGQGHACVKEQTGVQRLGKICVLGEILSAGSEDGFCCYWCLSPFSY